jgi:TolB-like protein
MSPEQDQKYLGNGIAEELLNALAGIEGLKVAARTSSFSLAARGASMTEIGDTLHVRHVLEGSVRRSGRKLRVTAQLIDVRSGFHLCSRSYDREVQDIFDIQNDIAREIGTALLPKLGLSKDVTLVRQGTANLEAYNLWLKAHQALTKANADTLQIAIEQLRQAIALDPKYGDAWGDLSYAYGFMATWADDPVPPLMRAATTATAALANLPINGTALLMQAYVSALVDYDPATAAAYYVKARAAGVDDSVWAFTKAYLHDGPLGNYDQAIAELKDAERNDPLAPNLKWVLVKTYLAAGRIAEAIPVAERLEKLEPRLPGAMLVSGDAFLAAGDSARARETLTAMRATTGDDFSYTLLLRFDIDAASGDLADVAQQLDRLLRQHGEGRSVSAYVIGEGYKVLGDYNRTFDWWTRAVEQHHPLALINVPMRNRNHPVIGEDPRFLALLRRMGLESDGDKKGT